MSSESLYERGLALIKEDHSKPLGLSWMIISLCERVRYHEYNDKFKWLQAFVLGKGEHPGLVGAATNIHLSWPLPQRKNSHRANHKDYSKRLLEVQGKVVEMLHILEALGYIAEMSLEDYEWEDSIREAIEKIVDNFDFAHVPDEDDRSGALRKIYKFKREYFASN